MSGLHTEEIWLLFTDTPQHPPFLEIPWLSLAKSLGIRKKSLHGRNTATNTVYPHWNYSSPWQLSKTQTALSKPISLSNTKTFGRCLANRKPAIYHLTGHITVLLISWLGKAQNHLRIYSLSCPEQEAMETYIREALVQGYIATLNASGQYQGGGWMENGFLDDFRTLSVSGHALWKNIPCLFFNV